ncbi:MAG: DEAD/DEAH box helicase [Chitinophagaceae bacterium]|nr:DEAD/DEAH box helicase [Chitinophagaceae bacterium]
MATQNLDSDKILLNLGYEELTQMQSESLEHFSGGKNIILSAPTGSGKTVGFLLMMLKIAPAGFKDTFALIITPTRELALQITEVFQKMKTGLKVTTCYGGHKREIEENNLLDAPFLIVGTPGRLGDHIRRGNIRTQNIQTLILDEFDKSLELGFEEEMKFIIDNLPGIKSSILTSATPIDSLPPFLNLTEVEQLDYSDAHEPQAHITKSTYKQEEKDNHLLKILCTAGSRRTIVFINEKESIKTIGKYLSSQGIPLAAYHGSMEQRDRETSIAKFRNGSVLFLITTDLASRGLDISHVRFIVHYDLPSSEEIFIHRNGRTARMDASGDIIVMTPEDTPLPEFIPDTIEEFPIKAAAQLPDKTEWTTLYISAGKKDKVNKGDIAGFLMKDAALKKEDVGLIEVKDFYSFAAIRRSKMNMLLGQGKKQKIKNKKVLLDVAR